MKEKEIIVERGNFNTYVWLTGASSPQDLPGGGAAAGKGNPQDPRHVSY